MRRSLCVLAALNHGVQTQKMKITNFKDWRFKDPPSYAALPIDENPEYNVPTAVTNAVFSKVRLYHTGYFHALLIPEHSEPRLLNAANSLRTRLAYRCSQNANMIDT